MSVGRSRLASEFTRRQDEFFVWLHPAERDLQHKKRSDIFNFLELREYDRTTFYPRWMRLEFFFLARHVIDIYPVCMLRDAIKLICVN